MTQEAGKNASFHIMMRSMRCQGTGTCLPGRPGSSPEVRRLRGVVGHLLLLNRSPSSPSGPPHGPSGGAAAAVAPSGSPRSTRSWRISSALLHSSISQSSAGAGSASARRDESNAEECDDHDELTSAAFHRDGAVLLRGALDAEALAECRAAYDWALEHPTKRAIVFVKDTGTQGGHRAERTHVRSKDEVAPGTPGRYYSENGASEGPHGERLVAHPAIQKALRRALGAEGTKEGVWHIGRQVFEKEPGAARTVWHQDSSEMPISGPDLITLWICFEPTSRQKRPDRPQSLEFLRGSHARFSDPTIQTYTAAFGPDLKANRGKNAVPNVEANRTEEERDLGIGKNILSFDTEPGDILAFNLATIHGGGPNPSSSPLPRRTLALRYFGTRAFVSLRDKMTAEKVAKLEPKNREIRAMQRGEGAPFRDEKYLKVL